ncbi:MAG: DNA gyrase subunit A [Mycoplasma sp.]|nr:DNA gyrase subunit A [Mycoplasma sp.]
MDKTDNLEPMNVSSEMRTSFLEYAMSVIVSRALPDARDGLKPVHRRIIYGMSELGITPGSSYKKSARIVGDVMGKYHPHGDSSIYEAMVRMSQDFSMRYPLVDGHGNFGSIDGDGAAAMRYTEVRMAKIASLMVDDIKKNVVDFTDNYDGSEREPLVLPSKIPNLLLSGATGIAVGMATNIPPHNLNEVLDGVIALAHNPEIEIEELMTYIKGPDFPTYGIITGDTGIKQAYLTGNGKVTTRSKTNIEILKNGKKRIIVTEIPYMVNKAKLIEKIALLSKDKVIHGISEIRDESSREGIRIVIVVKRDTAPEVLLNQLFKLTQLQNNFSVNMISLVNNQPKLLNLKEALKIFLDFQIEVLKRRIKFDLEKAEARIHILKGLKIAIENIDEVIKIIRASKNDQTAQESLMNSFNLSEIQAKAITDMRLGRLTGLAIEKMQLELNELEKEIEEYKAILADYKLQIETVIDVFNEIKRKFGDERRSEIIPGHFGEISNEDLIPVEEILITLSRKGYVKRLSILDCKKQNRGGVGAKLTSTYEDDDVHSITMTKTHTDLLIFTNLGKVYRMRAYEIPYSSKQAKGTPFQNLIPIQKGEKVVSLLSIDDYKESNCLLTITKKGILKRTSIIDYKRINVNGKIALKLKENDLLFSALLVHKDDEIVLGASNGKAIRFDVKEVRSMGRTSTGVIGMNFIGEPKTEIVGAAITKEGSKILTVGSLGFGKMSYVEEYRKTKRGAKGVKALESKKAGNLISLHVVDGNEDVILMTSSGVSIRLSLTQVNTTSRNTKGVRIIKINDNKSKISSVEIIPIEQIHERIEEVIRSTQEINLDFIAHPEEEDQKE